MKLVLKQLHKLIKMKYLSIILFVIFTSNFLVAQQKYDTTTSVLEKVGEQVMVSGKVASTYYTGANKGSILFINLDEPYPSNPITIIIMRDYRMEFPMVTEFEGKQILVKGFLQKNNKGKPTIFLKEAGQLVILDEQ